MRSAPTRSRRLGIDAGHSQHLVQAPVHLRLHSCVGGRGNHLPGFVEAHIGRAAVAPKKLFDGDDADGCLSLCLRSSRVLQLWFSRVLHLWSCRADVFFPWSFCAGPAARSRPGGCSGRPGRSVFRRHVRVLLLCRKSCCCVERPTHVRRRRSPPFELGGPIANDASRPCRPRSGIGSAALLFRECAHPGRARCASDRRIR